MQLKPVLKLTFLLSMVLILAVGCAKKPKVEESGQVSQTETQLPVTELSEQPVTELSEQPISEQESGMDQGTQGTMATADGALVRIQFDFDQYVLTADARVQLNNNATYLLNKGVSVRIEGHCDERGSDEYNLALGEKRALAVKTYLTSLGVPAERMNILSYGEEIPLVMGHDEEAWAQNRRAEFKELN